MIRTSPSPGAGAVAQRGRWVIAYESVRDRAERHIPRSRRWQRLWRVLYQASLVGMNYGGGAQYDDADTVPVGLLASESPVIFDAGAHTGSYTENVLRVRPRARVYAFEPAPEVFARLERNLGMRARTFCLGFSETPGEAQLFADAELSTSASLIPQQRSHWSRPVAFVPRARVRLTTVDAFCEEHGIERIDLLKLDVEGAELAALKGARRMLADGRVGMVQFEWGLPALAARVQLRDFFGLLAGWEIARIVPGGTVPLRWAERWEVPVTTNYLAIPPSRPGAPGSVPAQAACGS